LRSPRCARRAPGPSLPARGVQMQRGPRKAQAVSAAQKDCASRIAPRPPRGGGQSGSPEHNAALCKRAARLRRKDAAPSHNVALCLRVPERTPPTPAGGFTRCGNAALSVPTPRVGCARLALRCATLLVPVLAAARPPSKQKQRQKQKWYWLTLQSVAPCSGRQGQALRGRHKTAPP